MAESHQRIPLHAGNPEDISRVITIQDLLAEVAQGNLEKTLNDAGHEPIFVPPNQPVDGILDVLRANKQRLIVVVNEFGTLLGVFTIEDILEELVGEIYDDRESPARATVDLLTNENELLLDGTTELRVLESHFNRDLAGKPTDSVNLWIISHLERIPSPGERFLLEGLDVRIERASRRRIHEVRVSRQPALDPGQNPEPGPE